MVKERLEGKPGRRRPEIRLMKEFMRDAGIKSYIYL